MRKRGPDCIPPVAKSLCRNDCDSRSDAHYFKRECNWTTQVCQPLLSNFNHTFLAAFLFFIGSFAFMCIFACFMFACGSLVFGWDRLRFVPLSVTPIIKQLKEIPDACIKCSRMKLMKPEYLYETLNSVFDNQILAPLYVILFLNIYSQMSNSGLWTKKLYQ